MKLKYSFVQKCYSVINFTAETVAFDLIGECILLLSSRNFWVFLLRPGSMANLLVSIEFPYNSRTGCRFIFLRYLMNVAAFQSFIVLVYTYFMHAFFNESISVPWTGKVYVVNPGVHAGVFARCFSIVRPQGYSCASSSIGQWWVQRSHPRDIDVSWIRLFTLSAVCHQLCHSSITLPLLTLWCPLLPYAYSYKASCV